MAAWILFLPLVWQTLGQSQPTLGYSKPEDLVNRAKSMTKRELSLLLENDLIQLSMVNKKMNSAVNDAEQTIRRVSPHELLYDALARGEINPPSSLVQSDKASSGPSSTSAAGQEAHFRTP